MFADIKDCCTFDPTNKNKNKMNQPTSISELKVGMTFQCEIPDRETLKFKIVKITDSKVSIINLAGHSYVANINRIRQFAHTAKSVLENLKSGYWNFNISN